MHEHDQRGSIGIERDEALCGPLVRNRTGTAGVVCIFGDQRESRDHRGQPDRGRRGCNCGGLAVDGAGPGARLCRESFSAWRFNNWFTRIRSLVGLNRFHVLFSCSAIQAQIQL